MDDDIQIKWGGGGGMLLPRMILYQELVIGCV